MLKITDETRDAILNSYRNGNKTADIVALTGLSKASVAYVKQAYDAVMCNNDQEIETLRRNNPKVLEWAMKKLGKSLDSCVCINTEDIQSVDTTVTTQTNDLLRDILASLLRIEDMLK